jgi:hypothetical protein
VRKLAIAEVGRLLGLKLPGPGGKARCPFRDHRRKDKTFRVFKSNRTGDELWKCWSCDAPDNIGDAVALYARIQNVDRKVALEQLQERGYETHTRRSRPRRPAPRQARSHRPVCEVPVGGSFEGPFLALDLNHWRAWRSNGAESIAEFAARRRVRPATLRDNDVVQIKRGVIGFGYRDPDTLIPCRVKVRPLHRKTFWIEPRCKDPESGARARSPLYLAHALPDERGMNDVAVIVEGEVDALTLKDQGFQHVVSLPDGDHSANTVNVEPIASGYRAWLVATDYDEPGYEAYLKLRKRAWPLGIDVARVEWCALVEDDGREELVHYKDANEALIDGGFRRADFERCFVKASEAAFGCTLMP